MTAPALFSLGNALVDQEFLVDDEFLGHAELNKGTMQLCDAAQQAKLVEYLAEAEHKGQASGGSAANTTVAFSALGGTSFYACRVGNDDLASFYLNDLASVGVQTDEKSKSEGQTGTCIVLITPDGERTMYTHLGITAELSADQIHFDALKSAEWLYIEGYLSTSPSAIEAVKLSRDIAKKHQVKMAISLSDPAMVQYAKVGLDALIDDGVDVLFCNEQEALMFTAKSTLDEAVKALLELADTVAITLGAKGALIANREQETFTVQGQAVQAVDTNGAGDAFAGGFLSALVRGQSLQDAATLGNLVASKVVSQFGPRLSLEQYQALL